VIWLLFNLMLSVKTMFLCCSLQHLAVSGVIRSHGTQQMGPTQLVGSWGWYWVDVLCSAANGVPQLHPVVCTFKINSCFLCEKDVGLFR